MSIKKPTIAVVFCGGETTIAGSTSIMRVARGNDLQAWLDAFPEIGIIANIKPVYLNSPHGAIADGPKAWSDVAQKLWHLRTGVDGIVISYPSSQLAFLSAALHAMMPALKVPVITTGAEVHITDETDLDFIAYQTLGVKANFINAVHTASMDVAGVGLLYNTNIFEANDVTRVGVKQENVFTSYSGYELGSVDFSVHLTDDRLRRKDVAAEQFDPRFDPRVAVVQWQPGMSMSRIADAVPAGARGVVIKGEQALADERKLVDALIRFAKKVPTFVYANAELDLPQSMVLNKRPFELAVAQVMSFIAGAPLQRLQPTVV